MGLDGVEIVMRTEETFGIEIPDHVAQELQTPAALVDYVAQHVPCVSTEACLEQGEIDPLVQRGASQTTLLRSQQSHRVDTACPYGRHH